MRDFWEERYSQEEFIYGAEPNVFFAEQLKKLKPGKLLLPAEGEGRNAVYAAQQDWNVVAFDYSKAGQVKAQQLAKEKGVHIHYQIAEADKFTSYPENFDAVGLIYAHVSPAVRKVLHENVKEWIISGGTVILEAFHPKQLQGYPSGGPKDISMLYTAAMLQEDFKDFTIQLLEEKEITLSEGTHHKGNGYVTRMVAIKPITLKK
jgi:cyclopropane fatty-acyl-phospholipid synthase-like methyltransferase